MSDRQAGDLLGPGRAVGRIVVIGLRAATVLQPAVEAAFSDERCPAQDELRAILGVTHRIASRLADFLEGIETATQLDVAGAILAVNDRFRETLGYASAEVVGRRPSELATPRDVALAGLLVPDLGDVRVDGESAYFDGDDALRRIRLFDGLTCEEITSDPIPSGFAPGFTDPLLVIPPLE